MKKVLVLGDCQSNGNNCLADEVTGIKQPRTFSLRYHQNINQVLHWATKQIDFTASADNLESSTWKFLRKKEMNLAWPSMINANVINLSFNGAHFFGHCRRLIDWIKTNGTPDLVLITDYEFSHLSYSINYQGVRYYFESLTVANPDPVVECLRQQKLHKIFTRDRNWHARFHRRSFKLLIKILRHYQVNFAVLRFGQHKNYNRMVFDQFLNNDIDCSDLRKIYTIDNDNFDFGAELSQQKLQAQRIIAERVNKFINGP